MLNAQQQDEKNMIVEIISEYGSFISAEDIEDMILNTNYKSIPELPGDKKLDLRQIHDFIKAILLVLRDIKSRIEKMGTNTVPTKFKMEIGKSVIDISTSDKKMINELTKLLPKMIEVMEKHERKRSH